MVQVVFLIYQTNKSLIINSSLFFKSLSHAPRKTISVQAKEAGPKRSKRCIVLFLGFPSSSLHLFPACFSQSLTHDHLATATIIRQKREQGRFSERTSGLECAKGRWSVKNRVRKLENNWKDEPGGKSCGCDWVEGFTAFFFLLENWESAKRQGVFWEKRGGRVKGGKLEELFEARPRKWKACLYWESGGKFGVSGGALFGNRKWEQPVESNWWKNAKDVG